MVNLERVAVERITSSGVLSNVPTLVHGLHVQASVKPNIIRVTGSDPAAGAEISYSIPAGKCYKLLALRFRLVTSSTVASRVPRLLISDGSVDVYGDSANDSVTASDGWYFNAGEGSVRTGKSLYNQLFALPCNLVLPAGWKIYTNTSAIQTGDDWDAPYFLFEDLSDAYHVLNLHDGSNDSSELKYSIAVSRGASRVFDIKEPLLFKRGLYAALGSGIVSATLQYSMYAE